MLGCLAVSGLGVAWLLVEFWCLALWGMVRWGIVGTCCVQGRGWFFPGFSELIGLVGSVLLWVRSLWGWSSEVSGLGFGGESAAFVFRLGVPGMVVLGSVCGGMFLAVLLFGGRGGLRVGIVGGSACLVVCMCGGVPVSFGLFWGSALCGFWRAG